MPHIVDERHVTAAQAGGSGPGGQRRWHRWILLSALALATATCLFFLTVEALGPPSPVPPPAARHGAAAGGARVVRVLPSTGQVRGGPGFPEVNGIADGLGSVWVTGGDAGHSHVLYAVDPETGRVGARIGLPSRLVINPNDVATGSGAVWVAVGSAVYRVDPASASGGVVNRAFAALPHGDLIGDVVVHAGAVWVTDTARGEVYRFAVSGGRLEAVVAVGTTAGAMAVGDGGIWVADSDARTVSRISVRHNRVGEVLTFPGAPGHIAASGAGLWVTDGTGGVMMAPSGQPGRVLTVPVGGEPTGLAASGNTVWVASTADGTLSRIDTRRHVVVATVRVGARPYAVAAGQQGTWVALLGRPVTMQAPRRPSPAPGAGQPWLLRLCGG